MDTKTLYSLASQSGNHCPSGHREPRQFYREIIKLNGEVNRRAVANDLEWTDRSLATYRTNDPSCYAVLSKHVRHGLIVVRYIRCDYISDVWPQQSN